MSYSKTAVTISAYLLLVAFWPISAMDSGKQSVHLMLAKAALKLHEGEFVELLGHHSAHQCPQVRNLIIQNNFSQAMHQLIAREQKANPEQSTLSHWLNEISFAGNKTLVEEFLSEYGTQLNETDFEVAIENSTTGNSLFNQGRRRAGLPVFMPSANHEQVCKLLAYCADEYRYEESKKDQPLIIPSQDFLNVIKQLEEAASKN